MKALNSTELSNVAGGFCCLLQLLHIFKPAAPACLPPKPPTCEPPPPLDGGDDRC
ncbi:hypothetical protein [Herbaspirillum autotrophicum]|uniref:hypothetical protein n=1 Tax=Herbaspirillum autotrophicum TaxID=180195 RepID=UPI000A5CDAE7|nr:hypothetical protein [Herbaspirillum autotrophicum]